MSKSSVTENVSQPSASMVPPHDDDDYKFAPGLTSKGRPKKRIGAPTLTPSKISNNVVYSILIN